MSLGRKIRDLRVAKGLTQSDLGSGLVTPSMISQIESDKANPSYKVLEAIAEKLEMPIEYFLADIKAQMEDKSIQKVAQALLASGNHKQAAEVLESLRDRRSQHLDPIEVYLDLGACYLQLERYDEAFIQFYKAFETADQKEDPHAVIRALNQLGTVEHKRQKSHAAVFFWRTAYERFKQLEEQEPFIQSQVLMNLGMIYQQLGEFQESLSCYEKAHDLLRQGSSSLEQIGFTYLGLGTSYEKIKDYVRASEYSQYAIVLFESLKNIKLSIDAKKNYGILKGEEEQYTEAVRILSECMSEYEQHNHPAEAIAVREEIARLYLRQGKWEEAKRECQIALTVAAEKSLTSGKLLRTLAQAENSLGNLDQAVDSMEQALVAFRQQGSLQDITEAYSILGSLYEKQGNLLKSNECLQHMRQQLDASLKERGILL